MLTQILFRTFYATEKGLSNRFMDPDRWIYLILDSFKNVIHLITSQDKLKPNTFAVTISNDEVDTFLCVIM